MKKNNVECVTFTNQGYVEYTINLINSIIKNKIQINLTVFTVDEESQNYLKNYPVQVKSLKESFMQTNEFVDFHSKDFGYMMLYKFEMIYKSLLENEYVLYIDGDIVIKKNIIEYLLNEIGHKDMLIQNDHNPDKPNTINLCAGFMFIKSNKKTLNYFDPKNVDIKKLVNYSHHDQTYLNKNRNQFNFGILPLEKFSNGPYFYNNNGNYEPNLIHFNFLVGDKKKDRIKEFNEWYL
tara:strand:- start:40051 stop:40758 length:708 start_codon:yes stop_codon:yes gene_type:complete